MSNPLIDLDPELNVNCLPNAYTCNYYTPSEFNVHLKNNDEFSLIHLNARSLHKNFDNISEFLSTLNNNFSVIAISETWISGTPIIPFQLDGYDFVNFDRITGRGGGVCFFVKNDINFSVRNYIFLSADTETTCEYLFIDLFRHEKDNLTIGVFL